MRQKIKNVLNKILESLDLRTEFELREPPIGINFDLSTNIPLRVNKQFQRDVIEVADLIIKNMLEKYSAIFESATFFKPGFINFNIKKNIYIDELIRIINEKERYPVQEKKQKKVLIEFVSSNPTGPLHIGHGRCAVIGDVLSNIFVQQGYEVFREYYINDRGRQINILTASVLNSIKQKVELSPELILWVEKMLEDGEYKGEYIKQVGEQLLKFKIKKVEFKDLDYLKREVVNIIMEEIIDSLKKFNVKFDNYYSENMLYLTGEVDKILSVLKEKNLIETKDGALWFKSREMGDDKDRVIKRSNGEPTYFLSDIAYHMTKLSRGYDWLINIWGTDHHGYVQRLKSALQNIVEKKFDFDIILYQLVSLLKNGQRVSMSTREGKFVTLTEVMSDVGVDVTRYFLLTKTPDTHLDFDFDLAKEHSLKNPVYYIQYAYTRCCGILRESRINLEKVLSNKEEIVKEFENLKDENELLLVKKVCFYEDVLSSCIEILSPHPLCNYLLELSKTFHKFYENCRVINLDGRINFARIGLIFVTKTVLSNGLTILGLSSPEKM